MSATNDDIAAARMVHILETQYERLDGLNAAEARSRALAAARGREHASEAVFLEAVQRGEAELLALAQVARHREGLVGIGLSESEARRQALDFAWDTFAEVEAQHRDSTSGSGYSDLSEADRRVRNAMTDALRSRYGSTPAPEAGWDGQRVVDEAKAHAVLDRRLTALREPRT